jgi:3',5'-cyclic AMP phosphodiesterase CpdA
VANDFARFEWALALLKERFQTVVWAPGNHELHVYGADSSEARGEARYMELVRRCRAMGVLTPEDPYSVWEGAWGPIRVVPLFLLYDYSFRDPRVTQGDALRRAFEAGVVCDDEFVLDPHPYASRQAWCDARVTETAGRLESLEPLPSVLLNHFPLRIEPTEALIRPEFAQWCGTVQTRDWHRRFRAAAVVYGHLHIPRTIWQDGVPFEEVSLGYPKEWRRRGGSQPPEPRRVLPRKPPA